MQASTRMRYAAVGAGLIVTAAACASLGGLADGSGEADGGIDAAAVIDATCEECRGPAPVGFSSVAFTRGQATACPSGYEGLVDLDVEPVADASADGGGATTTCSCECVATDPSSAPTCKTGVVTYQVFGQNCNDPSDLVYDGSFPETDGGCTNVTLDGSVSKRVRMALPRPTKGCNGVAHATLTPPGRARLCAASPNAGCSGGGACVPTDGQFAACLATRGRAECPAGYGNRYLTGTNALDTRSCGACTCGASGGCSAADNAWLTLYTGKDCTGSPCYGWSEGCSEFGCGATNQAWSSFRYTGEYSGDGGCMVTSPSTPRGTFTLTDETTICCP